MVLLEKSNYYRDCMQISNILSFFFGSEWENPHQKGQQGIRIEMGGIWNRDGMEGNRNRNGMEGLGWKREGLCNRDGFLSVRGRGEPRNMEQEWDGLKKG